MLAVFAVLTCIMLAVILNDVTRFLIPNWLVLALLVVYPVAVYVSHARPDWKWACAAALIAFIFLAALFFMNLFGAGDTKLLSASMLYTGWNQASLDFIVLVAVLGGVLAVLFLAIRPPAKYFFNRLNKASSLPRVLTPGEKFIPYGVAIAGAFLYMLWTNKLPGLTL